MAYQPYNRSSIDELENIVENNHSSINTLKQVADDRPDNVRGEQKEMNLTLANYIKSEIMVTHIQFNECLAQTYCVKARCCIETFFIDSDWILRLFWISYV